VATLTWVIGRGGLLGKSVEAAIGSGDDLFRPSDRISWSAADGGSEELHRLARQFLMAAGHRPWSVLWCAGAGTVSASPEILQLELEALRATLKALGASTHPTNGTFFFASSAGGVYAGVGTPPYDESSSVRSLTAYGQSKLDAENSVIRWSERVGTPALIGRIANIYGPGQNINKAQGLISQICRGHLLGTPLSIYVPLDTLRDYLYAPDCADLIREAMLRLRHESAASNSQVVTKILASQRAVTVGAVLGEIRRIFKNPTHIVVAASAAPSAQARDLSLRSLVWSELDRRSLTPLPVGIARTAADLLRRLQGAELYPTR
jgi:UDP-glucose 4-epimerase